MALLFGLMLFLASWKCFHGALDLVERPSCNQTVVSLGALRKIARDGDTGSVEYTLCVTLPQGEVEAMNYSIEEIRYTSVIISGNDSVVKCEASPGGEPQYPLFFTNSSLVVIEGVHFEGCTRPIRFKWVTRIEMVQSNFTNFIPGGVLDISNSPQVVVSNCTFTNNTSLGIGMERYSGNAGAVAIGYDDRPIPEHLQNLPPVIRITGSTFKDNNSTAMEEFLYSVAEVLGQRIYNQRGGAIACYFGTSNYSADVEIVGCTFVGNYAHDSGGAVYMFLTGEDNGHLVKIQQCNFTGNAARLGGGAELTFDTSVGNSSDVLVNQALIEDCMFIKNRGRDGGGFSHIQINKQENLNNLTIKNCSFVENKAPLGSALSLKYIFTVNYNMLEKMIFIVDCTFERNSARYGVLFTSRNTIGIEGNTIFQDNIGPAIQSFGSLLTFSGHMMFTNNRNHPEGFSGVINLAAFGQIMLQRGANISFINNTGINGGGLVVTGQLKSAEQLYNPHCFLQYENSTAPPPTWNVTILFEDNEAEVGPVMYASSFIACTWFNEISPFFNPDLQETWSFMDIEDNYLLRGDRRSLRPGYYFQTPVQGVLFVDPLDNVSVLASPGEAVRINVQAEDGYSHNTTAFLELKDISAAGSEAVFEPSVVQTVAGTGQIEFKYLSSNTSGNTIVQLHPSFVPEELLALEVTLVHNPCLPGYFLRGGECICEETEIVALCDSQRRGVILVSGLWGAPPNWSQELVTHTCPPGYCDCSQGFDDSESIGCLLNYTNPDEICTETRKGQLCGQCKEGYGVGLLTNDCKKFRDKVPQFWLFPIYLGVVIPLLVVVVKFGVHLPTILRGFIFYVQISPIAVEFLPQNFRLRLDIISCFASILALYVPYDFNFHEGMTSLESYGLRYVTPLVALIVVPIAFRIRRTRSIYWHGVWTVVQLMYIMAIKTSASLLVCPTLTGKTSTGTSKVTIWFYDGSVRCFRGWHILLAVIALVTLLSLTLFIPLVAAALQSDFLREKVHPSFAKLESFSLALTRGFKKERRWWPLLDVVCKYVFVISSVFSLGHNVVPLVVSLLIFLLQFYLHPYEDISANYIESSLLLVLVLLLVLGNTTLVINRATSDEHFTLWPIFYFPVLVGGVVTAAYITYHILKLYKQKRELIKQKYNELISQRISFHRRKAGTSIFYQGYVTETEICLYDDELEGTDTVLDQS